MSNVEDPQLVAMWESTANIAEAVNVYIRKHGRAPTTDRQIRPYLRHQTPHSPMGAVTYSWRFGELGKGSYLEGVVAPIRVTARSAKGKEIVEDYEVNVPRALRPKWHRWLKANQRPTR